MFLRGVDTQMHTMTFHGSNNWCYSCENIWSVLEEKSSFKMLGLCVFSKLYWGSCNFSITKTCSEKIKALICSMKHLSAGMLFILRNVPYGLPGNTVVLLGLVLLSATWMF